MEPIEWLGRFCTLGLGESVILDFPRQAHLGTIVKHDTKRKDRRRKMPGISDKLEHGAPEAIDAASGLTPNLQAHIGRHVRAVFDEVAREPVPEHLLRLLKDLERSGDK
jgi:anti-sigma factor NepR-like protein